MMNTMTEQNFETEAEVEEREAVEAGVLEYPELASEVDEEPEGPCCGDRLCPCGGYRGGNHGSAPVWAG